jgi:hypothetical protein
LFFNGLNYLIVQVLVSIKETPPCEAVIVPEAHAPLATDFLVAFVITYVSVSEPPGDVTTQVHVRSFLQDVIDKAAIAITANNVLFFIDCFLINKLI